MIRLWKLGNLEHKIAPTQVAVDRFEQILAEAKERENKGDPFDIIWGPDIECELITESPDEDVTDKIVVIKPEDFSK